MRERERCIHKSLISLPSSSRTHSLSDCYAKHTQVRSILISLPTAPFFSFFFPESYPHLIWDWIRRLFLKVSWTKKRRAAVGCSPWRSSPALFNKKYPLHFNGCHIPQLADSTFMWSILCILFSWAHQVHLKSARAAASFYTLYMLVQFSSSLLAELFRGFEDVCELNKSTAWIWASDRSAVLSRAAPVQVESFQVSPRLLSRLESDLKSFEKSPSRRSNFLKRLYLKVFKSKSSIRQRWQVQTECLDKPSLMLFKKSPSHVTSHLRQVYNKHQVILRPSPSLRSLETYTSM